MQAFIVATNVYIHIYGTEGEMIFHFKLVIFCPSNEFLREVVIFCNGFERAAEGNVALHFLAAPPAEH